MIVYESETNGTIVAVILSGSDGIGGDGGTSGTGGIFSSTALSSTLIAGNTIIALNEGAFSGVGGTTQDTNGAIELPPAGTNAPTDVAGQFISAGHNLIGQADGSIGFTNHINSDFAGSSISEIDPMLGWVADNGGNTLTFALRPGSPAIDAGDDNLLEPPENLDRDQRGEARKSGLHVDIGAFEYDGIANGRVLPTLLTGSRFGGDPQVLFNAAPGFQFSIWASTDLTGWTKIGLASEVSRGWFSYQDFQATNYPHRFYQARYP